MSDRGPDRNARASVLAAMLILLDALPSYPATIYVNATSEAPEPDGTTWSGAFPSIQQATAIAVDGDEIWVAEGSYAETITLTHGMSLFGGFAGHETSRGERNAHRYVTTLNGSQAGCVITLAPGIETSLVIDGFTITGGGGSSAIFGGGISCNGASAVTISNNVISGNSAAYGGGVYSDSTCTLTGNTIFGNNADSGGGVFLSGSKITGTVSFNIIRNNIASSNGGGIQCEGGTFTLTNNLITNNVASTVGGGSGGGVFANRGTARLIANTIVQNTTSLIGNGDGVALTLVAATLVNNVVALNGSGIRGDEATVTIRNNDVFGNTTYDYSGVNDPTGSNGNIRSDPLFIDADHFDFRLTAGSPCVDAGDDTVLTSNAVDLIGTPRKLGLHTDIGAYETIRQNPVLLANAIDCLRAAAGLSAASSTDMARLDVVQSGSSLNVIDIADAARLARQAVGLDP